MLYAQRPCEGRSVLVPTEWGYAPTHDGYDDTGLPITRNAAVATITCPTCDESITFGARRSERQSGEEVGTDGRTVNEVFRFVSGRGRFTTSCRECERTARQRAAGNAVGSERLFGVELEFNIPSGMSYGDVARAIADAGVPVNSDYGEYFDPADYSLGWDFDDGEWRVKGDGSLGSHGCEVTSPPIKGQRGHEQVRRVCRALTSLGCTVDTRCGLHVHHDIRGARTTVAAVKRFVRSWYENQTLIDGLVSTSRRGDAYYAHPLQTSEVRRIEAVDNLEELSGIDIDRYRTVNVTSYPVHGTIEVRQHQGTLDSEKVSSWVQLAQAMLDDAEARQQPRGRAACVEDMLDRMGDKLNDTAKTFLIGRAVRFAHAPVVARVSA